MRTVDFNRSVKKCKSLRRAVVVALLAGTVAVPTGAWAEEFIQDFPELSAKGTAFIKGSCAEAQRSVALPPGYEIDYSVNNQGYLIDVLEMNDPNGSSVKHTLDPNTKTLTSYVKVCPKYNQRAWYKGLHILYGKKIEPSSTCSGVTNGLVACYPFDGNANDYSGNSYNGTVNGATLTTDRLENANKAYFFNGSSSVAVTTPWNKPHTGEITHSFWFNPSTNLNSSTERQNLLGAPTIQSYYVGSSQGWYGGSGLVFEIWGNFFPPKFYSVPMEFAPNTWHHVIIQAKEFGFARITIDGITHELEMPNFTFADPDPATGIKILIGMEWNQLYFKGKMDDVRIYNRAISEAEIKQLYGVTSSTEIVATPPATICAGSTFDVTIRVNKTDAQAIDGAELALKFDKSKLKVNKVTDSGVFDTVLDSKYDNATGDITFTAGAWNKPAATSSFDLFTINFTALSSTAGTTLLDFVNDSILLTSGGQAVTTTATDQTLTLNQCLNYKVNLQRANAKGDPSWMTPMKVSLGSAASVVEYDTTCDVNGLGRIILSKPVAAGDYICVKNSHTLANRVIQPFGDPVDFSTLLEGDAVNRGTGTELSNLKSDNIVDIFDLSFLTSHKGCKGTAGTQYDPQADFDVSSCVNEVDLALYKANYKKPSGCNWNTTQKMYRKGEREIRDGDRQTIGLSATALPDDVKVGNSFSYTIQINATSSQPADGAALYLNFDPAQLRVNQVTTGSSFDVTLENTFDNDTGEINVAAGVWDNTAPTTAVDLVTINFTALQAGEHTITFGNSPERETVITHAGEDVTGTTENGQIVVKPISTTEETVTCPLYGVQDQGLNDSILFTIDSESKQVLPLGETCTGCDIETIDIQPVTNVPYLASGNNARQHPNGHLYKLDTQTGELISVGNTGFKDISSLAFDKQGILWAWAKDAGLVKLDTGTGKGTVVIASSSAFADLTWNTEGTTLYGAIGTELWSYTPATDTVTKLCDNLPEKTEAIRVLPTVILPKGFLLLGAHKDDSLKLHAFDTETCQLVAEADILIPYDDVEGLAMPPAPCTTTK